MKRLLALILAFGLMLCLCACGGEQPEVTEEVQQTEQITEEITEEATEAPTEAEPTYSITVVDEENNPVAGARVQMCLESCVPGITDENGIANFFLEENDYKVSLLVMPEGYEYAGEEQEWYFADGETTMTIVLKKSA